MELKNCVYILIEPFITQQFVASYFDKSGNYTSTRLSNITDVFAIAKEQGLKDIVISAPHIAKSYATKYVDDATKYANSKYSEEHYHIIFN